MLLKAALSLLSFASLSIAQQIFPTDECPNLGRAWPVDPSLETSAAFCDAAQALPKRIDALFEAGRLNRTSSTFMIDVFSTVTNRSIYHYSHIGSDYKQYLSQGVLDENTIYRIGSISKLFTIYALLAKAGYGIFHHPVTKYLPELAGNSRINATNKIIWEDITIGALAAHMAGTGQFLVDGMICINGTIPGCSPQEYLQKVRDQKPPVTAPFWTPLYSDGGFGILGFVLERTTGLPYEDALKQTINKKMGLNSTTTYKPEGSFNGLVMPGITGPESAWGFDNQITAPSGGLYSTPADLRRLGLSIMHNQFLDAATTRNWMKPMAHTSSLTYSIGAPWEINRLTVNASINSTRYRISDLYTKLGGQSAYSAVFALSPDHGIGYSLVIAAPGVRPSSERLPLRDAIGELFIGAAELAAAQHAQRNFVGTFISDEVPNTNITITVDADRPGLGIQTMFINGTASRTLTLGAPGAAVPDNQNLTVRLYPTGLEQEVGSTTRLAYRSILQRTPPSPSSSRAAVEGGRGWFENSCQTFLSVDFATGGITNNFGVDEFILIVSRGRLQGVSYRTAGINFSRKLA